MTLHRFFVEDQGEESGRVRFSPQQSYQIRRVLRLSPGDRVLALDGSGSELVVRLVEVDPTASGPIEERRRNVAEPITCLNLYQGMLKGPKFEFVLQKCTEIGVSTFVPVLMQRSVAGEPGSGKQRRYETIVREAAEQSRRGIIPRLQPAISYAEALDSAIAAGPAVLLWEGEDAVRLREVPRVHGEPVSLLVGPEGGLTNEEVVAARERGVTIVTLGHRILRAETAAIVGSALLLAHLEDMG